MKEEIKMTGFTGLILVLLLIISSSASAGYFFNRKVEKEVQEMFKGVKENPKEIIRSEDLEGLPEPVQKWLNKSGIVGREKIKSVRLKQNGEIKTKPDGKWMEADAEQYFTIDKPEFIWQVKVKMAPLIGFIGRDKYEDGKGHMLIKFLSFFKVVDGKGKEIDQGTLLRYLGETVWFPGAVLSDYITWKSIDSKSAEATMSYGDITASAIFEFNEDGMPDKFRCKRYYAGPEGNSLEDYLVTVNEYKEMDGVIIPVKGEAIWELEEGNYSYYRLEITDVEYNKPEYYN